MQLSALGLFNWCFNSAKLMIGCTTRAYWKIAKSDYSHYTLKHWLHYISRCYRYLKGRCIDNIKMQHLHHIIEGDLVHNISQFPVCLYTVIYIDFFVIRLISLPIPQIIIKLLHVILELCLQRQITDMW